MPSLAGAQYRPDKNVKPTLSWGGQSQLCVRSQLTVEVIISPQSALRTFTHPTLTRLNWTLECLYRDGQRTAAHRGIIHTLYAACQRIVPHCIARMRHY